MRTLTLILATLAFVAGCGGGGQDSSADDGPQIPLSDDGDTSGGTPAAGAAEQSAAGVGLVRIGSFDAPTYVTAPPGDRRRLFVVEQPGTIRVLRDRRKRAAPFLDLRSDVQDGGERGLLSMAFAPDYARTGLFYVYLTGNDGDIHIQEFRRATAERADKRTRRELLRVEHSQNSNHNGGQLQFGPDGFLYAGFGDGGGGGDPFRAAQNVGRLLGKIIRIDPSGRGAGAYGIPRSNPYRGRSGARPEVFQYGFRNPWRFSFDRSTGDMTIADVGQDEVEEVDFVKRSRAPGRNFGWSKVEGRRRYNGGALGADYVPPVIQRFHSQGWCSITGGYIVRDRSLKSLYGRYIYGDFCDSALRSAKLRSGRAVGDRRTGLRVRALSSFGEDARGRVYAVSLSGPVYRLQSR